VLRDAAREVGIGEEVLSECLLREDAVASRELLQTAAAERRRLTR
jgi:hypothetical protein